MQVQGIFDTALRLSAICKSMNGHNIEESQNRLYIWGPEEVVFAVISDDNHLSPLKQMIAV